MEQAADELKERAREATLLVEEAHAQAAWLSEAADHADSLTKEQALTMAEHAVALNMEAAVRNSNLVAAILPVRPRQGRSGQG